MPRLDFDAVFNPSAVSVIGVSLTNPFHPANIIYNKNYYGYSINVYPVNPRGGELERRRIYRSVAEIPEQPDMAVIAVRAALTPEVARQCAEAGVRALVIISGGFAETGRRGRAYQDEVVSICRDAGMTLIGPNCFGVYSPPVFDSFFLPPERTVFPKKGSIAVASQSGAFLVDQIMTNFHEAGIGISVAVSMGNKAMVDEVDLLEYFSRRDDTGAVCFYLEGVLRNARGFLKAARGVVATKPVIVYLGARSEKGQQAAASHTAALAGDIKLVSAALKQSGVIEASTEREVASFAKIFTFYGHRPLLRGDVAVVSSSGGHGVMASDLAEGSGLRIPTFADSEIDEITDRLEPSLHGIATTANPVDLTGSASDQDFERVLDYVLSLDIIEAAMVLILPYTPLVTSFVGTRLGAVVKRHDKPVVAYVPNLAKYGMVLEGFELNGIPVVHSIEEAVQMLKALRLLGERTLRATSATVAAGQRGFL